MSIEKFKKKSNFLINLILFYIYFWYLAMFLLIISSKGPINLLKLSLSKDTIFPFVFTKNKDFNELIIKEFQEKSIKEFQKNQ